MSTTVVATYWLVHVPISELEVQKFRDMLGACYTGLDLPDGSGSRLPATALDDARIACVELESLAARFLTLFVLAARAQARGRVQLAGDDPGAAPGTLREAWTAWERVGAVDPALTLVTSGVRLPP